MRGSEFVLLFDSPQTWSQRSKAAADHQRIWAGVCRNREAHYSATYAGRSFRVCERWFRTRTRNRGGSLQ